MGQLNQTPWVCLQIGTLKLGLGFPFSFSLHQAHGASWIQPQAHRTHFSTSPVDEQGAQSVDLSFHQLCPKLS